MLSLGFQSVEVTHLALVGRSKHMMKRLKLVMLKVGEENGRLAVLLIFAPPNVIQVHSGKKPHSVCGA